MRLGPAVLLLFIHGMKRVNVLVSRYKDDGPESPGVLDRMDDDMLTISCCIDRSII